MKNFIDREPKKKWAIQGDRNTQYFHQAIVKRTRRNRINYLQNQDGTHATTQEQIAQTLHNYFTDIFASNRTNMGTESTTSPPCPNADTTDDHQTRSSDMNYTDSKPTIEELHQILKSMRNGASPGPDGLNAAFYKLAWPWIATDIYNLVIDFYNTAFMQPELNYTFLVLIPKKIQSIIPQDFRPISLCNVIYKLIAKSLANRLKPHLPNFIDQAQAAFVPNRHIATNVVITQEIVHSFHLKNWRQQAFLLKVDLAKAFDRLEWNFIRNALVRLGLNFHFINLIYACISNPNFSVLANGEPGDHFISTRGIRQGCPLSPYLFVVAINELSRTLQHEMNSNNLVGITLGPSCPPLHSLLFADDLILCGQATIQEATKINSILQTFCTHSGQTPNLQKSYILFSRNVDEATKQAIRTIFPVPNLQANTNHLGHPIIFNHNDRNRAYNFIYGKFKGKLTTIRANKLNHAGRLIYIQSVLSSIPVYYMSTVLFSQSFLHKITTIIRKFWWTGIQDDNTTNSIPYRSWDDICQPKENGGLGIRDLANINKSLIIQAAYSIATEKNPLLTAVLKAKYFHNKSFWTANTTGSRSIFWSSIMQVRTDLINNVTYQIQEGNSSIWSTPWISDWGTIHDQLKLPVTVQPLPSKVSDLWIPDTQQWDNNLINDIFHPTILQQIQEIIPVPTQQQDALRWKPAKNGVCTTKAIFRHLAAQDIIQLPNQGARSISQHSNYILNKAWKMKDLPPLIKTFTWRLIRRALATAKRASRYSHNIQPNCASCSLQEDDAHLFFFCDLPRAIWSTYHPSIDLSNIPTDPDGIQLILPYAIPNSLSRHDFAHRLVTLWYIWKARNDKRFNRKTWTPTQIHHAVVAFMNTTTIANNAGHPMNRQNIQFYHTQTQHIHQTINRAASLPIPLQGPTCYTDASVSPDQPNMASRTAGIGIFISNL